MAADLNAIRTKIRRLTRSPSIQQISDADIDEYINTFYLYDLPESLRLFSLKKTLSFFTEPHVDQYVSGEVSGLEDFKNLYSTIETPVYVAGNLAYYAQSREEFFNLYPIVSFRQTIATGDGVTTAFSGTLSNIPIMQHRVSFVSEDINGNALVLEDKTNSSLVNPNEEGDLMEPGKTTLAGGIGYVDGSYTFDFYLNNVITAPANGAIIQAQTRPYVASIPQAVLYYDNTFTLRPVPDKAYKITFDAYMRPTAFLDNPSSEPELEQWWQYLAYGAAKKIFEDRADIESVQIIMPEFLKQERLVLRRTLVQKATQQAATIYNFQGNGNWFNGGYWGNSS